MTTPFQKNARDVRYWYSMATKLDRAAKVLAREIEADLQRLEEEAPDASAVLTAAQVPGIQMADGFWLLAAFSLENLLKGILVAREPDLVQEQRLEKPLCSHRLLEMARRAHLDVNVIEAFFLEVASEYSTWAGKYPVPRQRRPSRTFTHLFSAGDLVAYNALYSRFEAELHALGGREAMYVRMGNPGRKGA